MKGGKTPLGYTIVEVMIVLAVSGAMFLVAANFISGKQERTAFTQGVNEMASRIQDVIEQVSDGQYSDIQLNCAFSGGSTTFPSGSNTQGTNTNCVFLGKLVSLAYPTTHDYQIVSMAGGRVTAPTTATVVSLSNVDPAAIASLTTAPQNIPQQLDVKGMKFVTTTGLSISEPTTAPPTSPALGSYNLGVVQGLGSGDGSGSFRSGAQTLSLVYSSLTPAGLNTAASSSSNSLGLATIQSATFCVTDGTQQARIVVGTKDAVLSVSVQRLN